MEIIRILLAEDHVVVRQGTRQLLELEPDFEVVGEADDGVQAVEGAVRLKPDVIIMDVAMPNMNGIEATKQIKKLFPSMVILILTSYDYDEYILSLLEAGAAGYLLKSVSGDDLVNAVRAVHNGEPVLHPVVIRKMMTNLRPQAAAKTALTRPTDLLSEREMEVLRLASRGFSNKDIGDTLFISIRTVQAHLRSIFNKLGVGSRSEAILYCLKKGWFSLDDLP